jgi:RimJ/RimL family protein N-acetyltransferase
MMRHLGGPEPPEKVAERLGRYMRHVEPGNRMFKIVASGEPVGSVGYWERDWRGGPVLEAGWSVIPEFQGRGIAATATAMALERARSDGLRRFVHAFPSVENAASNALCRKLGFTLLEECDFEYPPGHRMRCNDWRFDLRS